jgi:hypothetical protein
MDSQNTSLSLEQVALLDGEDLLIHFRSMLDAKTGVCASIETFENMIDTFHTHAYESPKPPSGTFEAMQATLQEAKELEPDVDPTEETGDSGMEIPMRHVQDLLDRFSGSINMVSDDIQQRIEPRRTWEEISEEVAPQVQQKIEADHFRELSPEEKVYLMKGLSRLYVAQIVLNEFIAELGAYHSALSFVSKKIPTHFEIYMGLWSAKTETCMELSREFLVDLCVC